MTDTRFDVLAIGNAIVDIIADTNDAFIASEGLTKGSMQLIDEERAQALYGHMGPATRRLLSGKWQPISWAKFLRMIFAPAAFILTFLPASVRHQRRVATYWLRLMRSAR